MDVFYRANLMDGLFHDQWSMEDGEPHGRKFVPMNHTISKISFLS